MTANAPAYGFPGFMPQFDEDGARDYLVKKGFPLGFAELIIKQSEKVAHRFFVSPQYSFLLPRITFCP